MRFSLLFGLENVNLCEICPKPLSAPSHQFILHWNQYQWICRRTRARVLYLFVCRDKAFSRRTFSSSCTNKKANGIDGYAISTDESMDLRNYRNYLDKTSSPAHKSSAHARKPWIFIWVWIILSEKFEQHSVTATWKMNWIALSWNFVRDTLCYFAKWHRRRQQHSFGVRKIRLAKSTSSSIM